MGNISAFLKAAAANDGQQPQNNLQHPIHKVLEMIDRTPSDMLEYDNKQSNDGSMTITFKIPSRAEQAKQKALEQSIRQQQQPQAKPTVDELAAERDIAPAAQVAAGKNVEIRVAMAEKTLKSKYPDGFLKAMGLL
jgi:hypothetical protein